MNKKGVLGIDTIKLVLISLLIITILAIVMFLALVNLRDVAESAETKLSATSTNDTILLAAGTTNYALTCGITSCYNLRNPTCTISNVVNNSGYPLNAANYTQSGCFVANATGTSQPATGWKFTYTYTYNTADANNIVGNVTSGSGNFFKQMPTVFTLLGVVLIILVIAIVIVAVSRFGVGGSMSFGGSTRADDEL